MLHVYLHAAHHSDRLSPFFCAFSAYTPCEICNSHYRLVYLSPSVSNLVMSASFAASQTFTGSATGPSSPFKVSISQKDTDTTPRIFSGKRLKTLQVSALFCPVAKAACSLGKGRRLIMRSVGRRRKQEDQRIPIQATLRPMKKPLARIMSSL